MDSQSCRSDKTTFATNAETGTTLWTCPAHCTRNSGTGTQGNLWCVCTTVSKSDSMDTARSMVPFRSTCLLKSWVSRNEERGCENCLIQQRLTQEPPEWMDEIDYEILGTTQVSIGGCLFRDCLFSQVHKDIASDGYSCRVSQRHHLPLLKKIHEPCCFMHVIMRRNRLKIHQKHVKRDGVAWCNLDSSFFHLKLM